MSVIPKEIIISELGSRFSFPENMKVEYDSFSGSLINEIVVKMVDKYDNFIAEQIAMEARANGISDLTVLNKHAILEIVRKAIPQQVSISENECLCPACNYDMMGLWDFPDVQDPSYCPICGQRLKWGASK